MPLHTAVMAKSFEMAKLLVEHGAEVNAVDGVVTNKHYIFYFYLH